MICPQEKKKRKKEKKKKRQERRRYNRCFSKHSSTTLAHFHGRRTILKTTYFSFLNGNSHNILLFSLANINFTNYKIDKFVLFLLILLSSVCFTVCTFCYYLYSFLLWRKWVLSVSFVFKPGLVCFPSQYWVTSWVELSRECSDITIGKTFREVERRD